MQVIFLLKISNKYYWIKRFDHKFYLVNLEVPTFNIHNIIIGKKNNQFMMIHKIYSKGEGRKLESF